MDSRILSAFALYGFLVLGAFLLVAPWTPIWQQATLVMLPTGMGSLVNSGWVRGLVSAIGALDLIVALQLAGSLLEQFRPTGRGGSDRA
jgi:hypothetical protein